MSAQAQELSTGQQLAAEPVLTHTPAHVSKVLVVILENHSQAHALAGMPRLAAVAKTYGYASDYTAISHPSLPNYLALVGGSTFGVTDDGGPDAHRLAGSYIFDQALSRGHTAKTYAESMTSNCQSAPQGEYAVKHNPWTYFAAAGSRADCQAHDVPAGSTVAGALRNDIAAGALPTVGLLVPNLCDDAHDCALSTADRWLASWLTAIRGGTDWRTGRLAVVVTFDEDDYSQANHVLTVVMAPNVHHVVARSPLNHYSVTEFADELTGNPGVRSAATARSLRSAFQL